VRLSRHLDDVARHAINSADFEMCDLLGDAAARLARLRVDLLGVFAEAADR